MMKTPKRARVLRTPFSTKNNLSTQIHSQVKNKMQKTYASRKKHIYIFFSNTEKKGDTKFRERDKHITIFILLCNKHLFFYKAMTTFLIV